MSRVWQRAVFLALLLLASPAAGDAADSERLALSAARWSIEGLGVELRIEPRRALAGQRFSALISVDGAAVERVEVAGVELRHRLRSAALIPGRHEIAVKSGTESSTISIYVLSRVWLWAGGALAAALLAALWSIRRRRRS